MPGPDFIIILATGIATVVMALVAIVQENLIRAVIAFAVSSICLAILFFLMASPYGLRYLSWW